MQRYLPLAALAVSVMTCDAQANRPPARPTPPVVEAPAPPPTFDPATVVPPEDGAVARVRARLAADPASAREIAEAGLRDASPPVAGRLRWLAAEAALATDDEVGAQGHLSALAASPHPLAPWARLRRAERLSESAPAESAAEAAQVAGDDWAGQREARTLEALGLAAAGETERAIPLLRALVDETPDQIGAATPGMPLAAILAEREDPAAREEALALYRRVATRAPKARVGQEALEAAARVLRTLPDERREALAEIPVDDLFARAEAFYGSMNHEEAEEAYGELVERLDGEENAARRCEARLMQGKAILRRRDRRRGGPFMVRVAEECTETDTRAWARYQAGRAFQAIGERPDAIAQYEALEREAPEHRLADDALYRAAIVAEGGGDDEGYVTRLRALPDRYPEGDMRGETLFRLAQRARERGEHEEAIEHLERALREGTGEEAEDILGRAAYWRARTLADLGRGDEARDGYAALAQDLPLSYYAQQAVARLDESHPEVAAAIREAMTPRDPEPLTFPLRPELEAPAMRRALELLRVGDVERAERELEHLGALGEGADPDMLWLSAALLDRAGAHPRAAQLVRRRLASFRRTMPVGRARELWRLAYPHAFAPLIEERAAAEGVPAALVRAIAREESSFDPKAVSWAHAYGLVQVILPTARRFGRPLGLTINAQTLKEPDTNLRVGTRFMSFLLERYDGHPGVIPAAYNAGHGRVDDWLEERGELPHDEWVERIPYDETRRYSRRVLQTYGIYSWLDEQTLPSLPARLPER